MRSERKDGKLRKTEVAFLEFLDSVDGMISTPRIAMHFKLERSTASGYLNGLSRHGLIERKLLKVGRYPQQKTAYWMITDNGRVHIVSKVEKVRLLNEALLEIENLKRDLMIEKGNLKIALDEIRRLAALLKDVRALTDGIDKTISA